MAIYTETILESIVFDHVSEYNVSPQTTDNVVFSDSAKTVLTSYIHDNIDIVDIIDVSKELCTVYESLVISDTSIVNVKRTIYISDGIFIQTNGRTITSAFASDGIDISDSSVLIYPLMAADNVDFSDASLKNISYLIKVYDTVDFFDNIIDNVSYSNIASDTLSISDSSKTVISVLAVDNVDIQTLSEGSLKVLVDDEIVVSDITTMKVIYGGEISEDLQITDDISVTRVAKVTASDNIDLTDSKSILFSVYSEILEDSITINEYPSFNISEYIKTIFDSFDMTDDANHYVHYRRKISNNVDINDISINTFISRNRLEESVSIIDSSIVGTYYSIPLEPTSDNNIAMSDSTIVTVSRQNISSFNNSLLSMIGTTEEILYTCTYDVAEIINISLANVISSSVIVDVKVYRNSIESFHLGNNIVIEAGETFIINSNEIGSTSILLGDEVKVISSEPDSVDAYIALIEI